mgnify:CR=1 FL=1
MSKLPLKYSQNFLTSQTLVKRIVSLADIAAGATILEIGPGKGIITTELVAQVGRDGRVIAVELDKQLAAGLRHQFRSQPQVNIKKQDILNLDLATLGRPYQVFSNIPFNITSLLLEHLFNPQTGPTSAHLILQTAALTETNRAGYQVHTFKSLLLQPLYSVGSVHQFARSDFSPRPGVDTALFRFEQREEPLIPAAQYELYKDFLAFVSKDRVGEGVWLKLFSKKQIKVINGRTDIVLNRGIKSQSLEAIVGAFKSFTAVAADKRPLIQDAMQTLRAEQARKDQINRRRGHHRSRRNASSSRKRPQ